MAQDFTLPTTGGDSLRVYKSAFEASINDAFRARDEKIEAVSMGMSPAGGWDAASSEFPAGAVFRTFYLVSNEGVVDGVLYRAGDWLIPLKSDASTTDASDWVVGRYGRNTTAQTTALEIDVLSYVPTSQHRAILDQDLSAQDEAAVTPGVQEAMQAAMNFVKAAPTERSVVIRAAGLFAINDEMFPETFAEDLWHLSSDAATRFIFEFTGATFHAKAWRGHAAVRTSGFYKQNGIADPVPTVMFRWEQRTKQGWGPTIKGGILKGETATTDPIGYKGRNINLGLYDALEIHGFRNVGRWLDDINNSDFRNTVIHDCGMQPTQAGGEGFMPEAVRFTVSGNSVTATQGVFTSQHVGRWVMVNDAGQSGTVGSAVIASVDSGTQVTLDRSLEPVSGQTGSFAMIEGGIGANSNTLTLTTDCTLDLVGRYVMVYKAGSKIHGEEDVLVTRVIAQTGRTLTLATQARETVSDTPICLAPSSYIGKCDDQVKQDGSAEPGHNNDCQFLGERIEFSFDGEWGSAISAVEQYVLAIQFLGRKMHGTGMTYTNFGANGAIRWADNCKYSVDIGSQYEWGDWHPTRAKVCISGARSVIILNTCNIGGVETGDRTGFFLLDPQSPGAANCRLLVSGVNNTIPSQLGLDGAMFRYGTNGSPDQVSACGPFVSRAQEGYPDMPSMHARRLDLFDLTPALHFRDTNSTVRGRLSMNGGALSYDADLDGDGTYGSPVFDLVNVGGAVEMRMGGEKVLSLPKSGWQGPTGTASRASFNTATVSTEQLAQVVKAMLDDFLGHHRLFKS